MTRKQESLFDVDAVAPIVIAPVPPDAYELARELLAAHDAAAREWKRNGGSWEWMFQNAQAQGRAEDLAAYTSGAGDFREAAAAVVALIAEGQSDELVCRSSVAEIEAHITKTDAAVERLRTLVPGATVIPIERKRVTS